MPMYTHKCDTCHRLVAVKCSIAERDTPKPCKEQPLEIAAPPPPALGRRPEATVKMGDCPGTLTRPAGDVDATAFTPYGWKP